MAPVCIGILKWPSWMPVKGCLSSRVDELASGSWSGEQAKSKSFLPCMPFAVGCHPKVWPRLRVDLPSSLKSSRPKKKKKEPTPVYPILGF